MEILMISGSLRPGSTNTSLLRTAQIVAPPGISAVLYDGMGALPHFNPDDDRDPLDPGVDDLRQSIAAANALLLSTPEYAGGLPGSFKNLLDWTVGGGETYGMPLAWVNASASPTGATDAYESLRIVASRTGADIVTSACAHIPVPRSAVGPDGLIADPAIRADIAAVLSAVARHVRRAVSPT